MKWVLGVALLALAGCQGTPIGDAMIGKEKLAAMDDEYCRSIGATPRTDTYAQCRMFRSAQRERSHQAAYQRASASMASTSASFNRAAANTTAANRTVTCQNVPAPTGMTKVRCY